MVSNARSVQATARFSAEEWTERIQANLQVISPYGETKDIPLSVKIDEAIMEAPRRKSADPDRAALAKKISQLLYPSAEDSLSSIINYEKDIVGLRHAVLHLRKLAIDVATQRNHDMTWAGKIAKQGPWDPATDPLPLTGAPSLPMPVEIAVYETLEPFFDHLRTGGTEERESTARALTDAIEAGEEPYGVKSLEFKKGVIYSDRRMDLCKMVLGPPNIGPLLESLKTNTFVNHFLLGNNIIGPHGARVIADFLREFPNRIDTWYLAGNCIDTASFGLLVDEWTKSTSVTNIWLKRNPLFQSAASDIFRLITETPNLRTLDLDQTEIGDASVADVFMRLANHTAQKPLALRHLYLNGTGISVHACSAIADYLSRADCTLDSLYMNNNPVGSAGFVSLAVGIKKNKSLSRLAIASTGMTDPGAVALCEALYHHPKLMTLDMGQNFATADLGMRYNWITDTSAAALAHLISSLPNLQYFDLDHAALSHIGLNQILQAVLKSPSILYFSGNTIHPQNRDAVSIRQGQIHSALVKEAHSHLLANVKRRYGSEMTYEEFFNEEKRWLVSDRVDVRKIDSVYRNRDAGMARRGLKRLDKWWNEGDTTLEGVMKSVGAVGPVCTKRLNAVGPICTKRKGVAAASA